LGQPLNSSTEWGATGTWNGMFGAHPNEIVLVTGGAVADLKRV
jgi:hypothetical protein